MSHFTVLVITQDGSTEAIDEALRPYHEFECTGQDDEYVVDVDITEEARASFEASKQVFYVGPDGERVSREDDRFYRDLTEAERTLLSPIGLLGSGVGHGLAWKSKDWDGTGYRAKVHYLPEGWSEIRQPAAEAISFLEFVKSDYGHEPVAAKSSQALALKTEQHKFGFVEVNADGEVLRVVKRTNPAAHWDWHQIGGRWGNMLILKPGRTGISFRKQQLEKQLEFTKQFMAATGAAEGNRRHAEELSSSIAALDDPSMERTEEGVWTAPRMRADIAFKGDIDLEFMRQDAARVAGERYDRVRAVIDPFLPFEHWDKVMERFPEDRDAARKFYWEQAAVAASRKTLFELIGLDSLEEYDVPRDEYTGKASRNALSTYAVIKDGVWYQRGDMGWFGCTSDEVSEDEWATQFSMLVDGLPDNKVLAIVDCHI